MKTKTESTFNAADFRQAFFTILQAKVGRNSLLLESAFDVTIKGTIGLALKAEKAMRTVIEADGAVEVES